MFEHPKKNLSDWINAARPKTLPLSLSGTTLGSFLAAADGTFSWSVLILASLTTLLLQILSNLANDYGDFVNGKDTAVRIGPKRMLQSGQISPRRMVKALFVLVFVTLIVGTALVLVGTSGGTAGITVFYFLMGISAVIAALKYTIGNNPYGYRGLGDLFVLVFFGLISVIGTYYLHTHKFRFDLVLPAASIGLLSTGVLNLNNLRDEQSDRQAHKRTFVIIIGSSNAKTYHVTLLATAVIAGLAYSIMNYRSGFQLLFLLSLPPLARNIKIVFQHRQPAELIPELMNLSLSTLLFAVTFGVGLLIR